MKARHSIGDIVYAIRNKVEYAERQCKTCGGSGKLRLPYSREVQCHTCKGSGKEPSLLILPAEVVEFEISTIITVTKKNSVKTTYRSSDFVADENFLFDDMQTATRFMNTMRRNLLEAALQGHELEIGEIPGTYQCTTCGQVFAWKE